MPEWLFDFLSGPTIKIAEAIWNSSMRLIIQKESVPKLL